jgi:hypothetical protein
MKMKGSFEDVVNTYKYGSFVALMGMSNYSCCLVQGDPGQDVKSTEIKARAKAKRNSSFCQIHAKFRKYVDCALKRNLFCM